MTITNRARTRNSRFGRDRGGRNPPPDAAARQHRLLPLTRPSPVAMVDAIERGLTQGHCVGEAVNALELRQS
jgi:hypothetical protein